MLPCEGNRAGLACLACKGFQGHGICSHVLAINHILTKFNVRYELQQLQTRASKKSAKKGGHREKMPKALKRLPVAEPDSSDEEEAAMLALGARGM